MFTHNNVRYDKMSVAKGEKDTPDAGAVKPPTPTRRAARPDVQSSGQKEKKRGTKNEN